jgi:hypothetical protein
LSFFFEVFFLTHQEVNRKVARVKGADDKSAVKKIQALLLNQVGCR